MKIEKELSPQTRAALYIRVSTEEQVLHGLSIEAQTAALDAWAKENHIDVVDHYTDAGISGRKPAVKRPELQRLLRDVQAGKIDLIAFTKLDRWFRNVSEYYKVQEILDANKVTWRTIHEDYETTTSSGRFKVNIMLGVAENEADRTSERIKAVFDAKRERNEMPAGSLPRGYKRDGRAIVLDEEIAPIVRAAFDLYFETGSPSKVIRAFPELHLNLKTARYMFSSPSYAGTVSGVTIPAIITQEEHEKALILRSAPARKARKNRVYLFSGMVFCPICGNRLGGKPHPTRSGGEWLYYVCGNASDRKTCTNRKIYNESAIEQFLLDHIDGKLTFLLELQRKKSENHKPKRDALKKKLTLLSELWIDELISKEDYRRQYQELTEALKAIPEDRPAVDIQAIQEYFSGNWRDSYAELTADGKRAFWRQCIKAIYVNPETNSIRDFDLQ